MSWFKKFFCSHMLCQMGKNIFYKLLLKWVQNTALKFGTAEFPVDRGQTAWSTQVKLTCCWVPPRGKLSGWSSTLTLIFLFLLSSKENSYPVPWLEGSDKLLPVLLTLKNQRDRKAGRRITLAAEEGHWIHRVNTSVVCVTPKSFTHLYILPCIAPRPKDPDSDFCSYTLLKIKQTLNQPHKHPEDILGQQAFGTFWMTMTLPHFPHHQLFPLESAGEQIPPGQPTFLLLGLGNTVCKESENNHIMIKHFTLPTGYYKLHIRNKKHGHCRTVWLNARYNTLSISKQKGDNVMKENNAWKR